MIIMRKQLFIGLSAAILLTSCGSSEDDKIKELEAKVNQQQDQINQTEKDRLQSEIDQQRKELESIKNRKNNNVQRDGFFAKGSGYYPEGSDRRLTESDVLGLSSRDLKIMRNEIFARHGYIFKTQDMIDHFSRQSWYEPLYNDVTSMLSAVEKANVNFIRSYE